MSQCVEGIECSGGNLYKFIPPMAEKDTLGGIKAEERNEENKEVFIDKETGKLYVDGSVDEEVIKSRDNIFLNRYTSLSERLNGDFDYLYNRTRTPRETTKLEGNDIELQFDNMKPTSTEYCFTDGTVKSVSFSNVRDTFLSEPEYWALFVFPKSELVSEVKDIVLNEDIKLLNRDLDISEYSVIHLLFTNDGLNICCLVTGY
jgi:hypothetical protein